MIKLSKRMTAVARLVSEGSRLCDVGTDHAYVPIYLVQSGTIDHAIAMDIGKGPLQRAREHIREWGLEDSIETRLSDGLKELAPNEADSVVIAGMGGELMIRILTAGEDICRSTGELILQPQSDIRKVRRYIREVGYMLVDEDMVYEDGKFYPMMKVMPAMDNSAWKSLDQDTLNISDIYGPLLIKHGNLVLRKFLIGEHRKLNKILEQLHRQEESEAISRRIREVEREIYYNESAYSTLGAIKDAGI